MFWKRIKHDKFNFNTVSSFYVYCVSDSYNSDLITSIISSNFNYDELVID